MTPLPRRPDWCPDYTCQPLTSLWDTDDERTGTCIGKMEAAQDHGSLKSINDKRWCVHSGSLRQLMVNNDDFEFFIYQMTIAAQRDGKPLKLWMLNKIKEQKAQVRAAAYRFGSL